MKTLILTTAALATLITFGAANAADMGAPPPAYKAPAPPPPVYNWTGCYVGGGGGYGMWNQDTFLETNPGLVGTSGTTTNGGRGWFGMAQGGCDYQFTTPFLGSHPVVIGAFGDYNFDDLNGTMNLGATFGNEKQSSAWAAGGRAGLLVTPRFLTYFDGGYTETRFDQVSFGNGTSIGATTYNGWFLGSGFEYSFDFLPIPGLFLKTEYRYSTFNAADIPIAGTATAVNSKKFTQLISTEVIWRFNWF